MESRIETFSYPNGDIQRVQLVQPDRWEDLDFLRLSYEEPALEGFYKIYKQFLVPGCPWLFGNMIMFRLPEDLETPLDFVSRKFGAICDPVTAAAAMLRKGVKIMGKKPVFFTAEARQLWQELERKHCLYLVSGKLPVTTVIPVGNLAGFMSHKEPQAVMKVNASFFIMDRFDCATVYDRVGTPLGLLVKDGVVENPPQFDREALLVKRDGTVTVTAPRIQDMEIRIGDHTFRHGENAVVFTRPDHNVTPLAKGKKLVIIGTKVEAVHTGQHVAIPASGFVLSVDPSIPVKPGDGVTYGGMEDVSFGIQVGNSIVRNGIKTDGFISRFYNIRKFERVPFPPSLYPLDYSGARAARIALGADVDGRPMILWAEGAAKLGYVKGQHSCGASLTELAEICAKLGMVNGVNLDGGGSAQILLNNQRALQISDRNADNFRESERAVPLALIVR